MYYTHKLQKKQTVVLHSYFHIHIATVHTVYTYKHKMNEYIQCLA